MVTRLMNLLRRRWRPLAARYTALGNPVGQPPKVIAATLGKPTTTYQAPDGLKHCVWMSDGFSVILAFDKGICRGEVAKSVAQDSSAP